MLDRRRLLLLSMGGALGYLTNFTTKSNNTKYLFPYVDSNVKKYYRVTFPSGTKVFTRENYIDLSVEEGEKTIEISYYNKFFGIFNRTYPYLTAWAVVKNLDKTILANYYDVDVEEVESHNASGTTFIDFNPEIYSLDFRKYTSGNVYMYHQPMDEVDLRDSEVEWGAFEFRNSKPLEKSHFDFYTDGSTRIKVLNLRGSYVNIVNGEDNQVKEINLVEARFKNGYADLRSFVALERIDSPNYFTYFTILDISNCINLKYYNISRDSGGNSGLNYQLILPTQYYELDYFLDYIYKNQSEPEETLRFYGKVKELFLYGDRYKEEIIIDYPLAVERLGTTSREVANITSMTNLTYLYITGDFQTITDMSLLPSSVTELRIDGEGGHDYSDNSVIGNLRHTNLTRATTDLSGMNSLYSIYIQFPHLETTTIIPPTSNIVNYINISVNSTTGGTDQSILDTLDLALDSTITNGTYRWRGGGFNGSAFPQDVKDKVDLLITKGWDAKIERGGGYQTPKQVYP